jgi:hypothetical protein
MKNSTTTIVIIACSAFVGIVVGVKIWPHLSSNETAEVRLSNVMADNMMLVSPEWNAKFGSGLESRQTFNINMLVQVVNRQQQMITALQKPVEDPNG